MLVGDVKTFLQYARVHRNFNFASLKPFLDDSKLHSVLSKDLYDKLLTAYENDTLDDPDNKVLADLLPLCQKYLVYHSLYTSFHQLRNHVSELGVQQTFDNSAATSRPAPVQDAKALRLNYCQEAYRALDEIYLFLEKNQKSNLLVDWVASDSYTYNYELLVRSATVMGRYISIVKSRQTYLAIRPQIRNSELLTLRSDLGHDLYHDLLAYVKAKEKGNNLSIFPVEYEDLLPICEALVCNDALKRAVALLDVYLEGDNLYLSEYMSTDYTMKTSNERNIEQLSSQLKKDFDSWSTELRNYLQANIDNLPKYIGNQLRKSCQDVPSKHTPSNFSITKRR
jgi:hypothetical protein